MTKNNCPRKAKQIMNKKRRFSKLLKIGLFYPFSNFKPKYFCHFWFFTKKNFFQVKLTFVSPKKILGSYLKYSQNAGLIWEGGGCKWTLFPPPKNEKFDFASIVVKH